MWRISWSLFGVIKRQDNRNNKCDVTWNELCAFADGEAGERRAERIKRHLEQCSNCKSANDFLTSAHRVLGSSPELEPPLWLRQNILDATVNRPARVSQPVFAVLARPANILAFAGTGLAAVVMAAGLFLGTSDRKDTQKENEYNTPGLASRLTSPTSRPIDTAIASNRRDRAVIADASPSTSKVATRQARPRRENIQIMTAMMRKNPTVVVDRTDSRGFFFGTRREAKFASSGSELEEPDSAGSITVGIENAANSRSTVMAPVDSSAPVNAAVVPAAVAKPAMTRIVLAATVPPNCSEQIATLATLKQQLRGQRSSWHLDGFSRRQRDGQLNVDIIKGSF